MEKYKGNEKITAHESQKRNFSKGRTEKRVLFDDTIRITLILNNY